MSINLVNPTPAKLRQECIVVFRGMLTEDEPDPIDLMLLRTFFERPGGEDIRLSTIRTFDIDKFKPLCNFLKGRTRNTSDKNLELLAWLIDFSLRPYTRYEYYETRRGRDLSTLIVSKVGNFVESFAGAPVDSLPSYSNAGTFEEQATKRITLEYPSGVKISVDANDIQLIEQLVKLGLGFTDFRNTLP